MKTVAIIGATSALATACARLWSVEPMRFHLVGRNREKLERLAADLRVRNERSEVHVFAADLLSFEQIDRVVSQIFSQPVDLALVAHGWLPDQDLAEGDLAMAEEVLNVNGVSPALWAEALADRMEASGRGTLALISSVAGERGRRSNYIYGAAKGMLTRYAEGLQHRFFKSPIRVVLLKPGPTDTPMTENYRGPRPAPLFLVAKQIVEAIERGQSVSYAPKYWRMIMSVIRILPNALFFRMRI